MAGNLLLSVYIIYWIVIINISNGVNGRFVVEKNSIIVPSPYNLRSGKHYAANGNFGVPEYGGSMVGSVVYPHKYAYACKPFDDAHNKQPFKSNSSRLTILLLDHGDFHIKYSMKRKKYSKECAEDVLKSLHLPIEKIKGCMGDPEADVENEVLKIEQNRQVGKGSRGDVTILPTLIINEIQYGGKHERTAVLKAICAGFQQTTDPTICLSGDLETNQCLERNGGCWQDSESNITACKDAFRGRVCECPVANGVQYKGDGYMSCKAVGPGRCAINNGGCWSETRYGQTLSACSDSDITGYRCPHGFQGDGHKCEDINECKEGLACQCEGCSCKNTWGGYGCKCKGEKLYIMEQDTCIERNSTKFGWLLALLVLGAVISAATAGYIFYKYRFWSYMDSEVLAIMSQYMPLDSQHHN